MKNKNISTILLITSPADNQIHLFLRFLYKKKIKIIIYRTIFFKQQLIHNGGSTA